MKLIIIVITIFSSVFAAAGEEIKSQDLRLMICREIGKNFQESETACLEGKLTFSKKAVTQEIAGEDIVVRFFADASFEGKTYSSVVSAELAVDATGSIVRKGWVVTEVTKTGLSNEALLLETSTYNNNAQPVAHTNLSSKIQKAIDNFKDTEREYFGDASDWEDGDREYFLVKNSQGNTIGYLVSDSWQSESLDVKIFFTLKFDSSGKFVDSESESFGYHE